MMNKKSLYLFLLISVLLCGTLQAQDSPKREFRSVWLTTVWAIDWPNVTGTGTATAQSQKDFLCKLMDRYQRTNMNAFCLQVRPMSDAFYKSQYEPWSQYLTGTRGAEPAYDPMAFAIEEAHKRGLEFHAWLNPYRYATGSSNYGTGPNDYATTHPEWLFTNANGITVLNPGLPEVREQIVKVVVDIVSNYDVDGILFDDYFYPDGGMTDDLDAETYKKYNTDSLSLGDWRRQNVNKMVAEVYAAIKATKPWVRFGIGPAGVAASSKEVAAKHGVSPCPSGSDWQYNGIYSDPLAWYEEHTVDYMAPQVYWTIGSGNDYSKITPWWSEIAHHFGRHVYISHSLSALTSGGNMPRRWAGAEEGATEQEAMSAARKISVQTENVLFYGQEIYNQIEINRSSSKDGAPGSIFYSDKPFRTTSNFATNLQKKEYIYPALAPTMTWFAPDEQGLVTSIALSGNQLTWEYDKTNVRYAVYGIPKANSSATDILLAKYLCGLAYDKSYTLPSGITTDDYDIAITVVDRYGYEYAPSMLGQTVTTIDAPTLTSPIKDAKVLLPTTLTWQKVSGATGYMVQVAQDAEFKNILLTQTTTEAELSTQAYSTIDGSAEYWWRVRAYAKNAQSEWSATAHFVGRLFSVTKPKNGAVDVEAEAYIEWDEIEGATYLCQVANNALFRQQDIVYSQNTTDTHLSVPEETLLYGYTYYARVIATTSERETISQTSEFTIIKMDIPTPTIIKPKNGETVTTADIEVVVDKQPNNGFRFEVSQYDEFPSRYTRRVNTDVNVYTATYSGMLEGVLYIRVAAKTDAGLSEYSEVVTIDYQPVTEGVEDIDSEIHIHNGILTAPISMRFAIYTIDGRIVEERVTTDTETTLPLLPTGLYIVQYGDKAVLFSAN